MTVEDIIEQARGLHSAFDRLSTPDKPMLKAIQRATRTLHADVLRVNPDAAVPERCELEISTFDFEDGELLEGFNYLVDSWVVNIQGDVCNFSVLTSEHRVSPEKWPAGFMRGNRLFLIHDKNSWTPQHKSVVVEYIKDPTEPTALASVISLPVEGEEALVAAVGYYLAQRTRGSSTGPGINVREFRDERDRARNDFITAIGNRRTAHVGSVREVW